MENTTVKSEARRLVEELPESATWDELIEMICTRQAIEQGLEEIRAGKGIPEEEVWKEFDLPQ